MTRPALNTVPTLDLPALSELDLPAPVSMFPETIGWQILLAAVALVLVLLLLRRYRRYRRNRWRRQAKALAETATEAASIGAWIELIKRVTLVHTARERLAVMDDQTLLNQLAHLTKPVVSAMVGGHHRRYDRLEAAENEAVAKAFTRWLKELPDVG